MIQFQAPLKLVSEANCREHWSKKSRRAKLQRETAAACTRSELRAFHRQLVAPLVVTITRIGVRKLDDDNLARSGKAIRDGIADALGIDDGSDAIKWQYSQRKGAPREYAVHVSIEDSV